jgi:multisubunit Na+/H+ antiporter MnhB subunit
MNLSLVLDLCLALLVLAAAAWSVFTRRSFGATIAFVAFGLLGSIVWVRLGAVDVALTEAALGSGLTGVLLLRAAASLRDTPADAGGSPSAVRKLLAALACACVTGGLAFVVLNTSDPAPTLAPAALAPLPDLGLGNPVTAVLIAYRAIDTLLEVIVVVLSLVAVWSLAPDAAWGGCAGSPRTASDDVLAHFGKVLPPFGLVLACYIFWVGSDAPGGEFQSAAVLAASLLLIVLSGVRAAPAIAGTGLRRLTVLGPLVFIVVGLVGMLTAGAFLGYPPGQAKAYIKIIEVPVTLSLAIMLMLLVLGPPEQAEEA